MCGTPPVRVTSTVTGVCRLPAESSIMSFLQEQFSRWGTMKMVGWKLIYDEEDTRWWVSQWRHRMVTHCTYTMYTVTAHVNELAGWWSLCFSSVHVMQ